MSNPGFKDAVILHQIANGEAKALECLYDTYGQTAYSLAIRIVKDNGIAEDIVQEAFLRVWQGARSYDSTRGKVVTWILTITHNLCIDEVRRRKSRPQPATYNTRFIDAPDEDPILTIPDRSPGVEERALQNVTADIVREALYSLPKDQYDVIELAYFQGYTHSEIAKHLNLPLGTIKTRMLLGIKKLNQFLREHGEHV